MQATEVTRPDGTRFVSAQTYAGLAGVYRASDGYELREVSGRWGKYGFVVTPGYVPRHAGGHEPVRAGVYEPLHAARAV